MTRMDLTGAFREGYGQAVSWSGLPLRDCYGPADAAARDYGSQVGDPGQFPFTRGIHPDMYRGRLWTRREVCGIGSPEMTNERTLFLLSQGATAPNVIVDLPTHFAIDPDHPMARGEIGVTGVNVCHLADMRRLMQGIEQDKVSFSLVSSTSTAPVILAQYLAVAQERGLDPGGLRGSIQNDPVHMRYCGLRQALPLPLALKTACDIIEYTARHMPLWHPTTVNMYDLREQGLTAPQELAFGFATAFLYMDKVMERGLAIDQFAPRLSFYCSCHIDFFEEIAKLRAARRIWARTLRERYGARDERSLKFKFAVHTAGVSLVPQEPLNNVVRVAIEALAAALAGAQSVHTCSYDEPIALPTEQAHKLALRTQQILAYETGVAAVADPLGGSYYMEDLTDRLEAEAQRWLGRIDEAGGMQQAIESGWLDQQIDAAAVERQRELERGDKRIVTVNLFPSPPETSTPGGVQRLDPQIEAARIRAVREYRQQRDSTGLRKAIDQLRREADLGERHNLIPAIIACVQAGGTVAEILGTVRMCLGFSYDPFDRLKFPFN